jgi:hypothetical protein
VLWDNISKNEKGFRVERKLHAEPDRWESVGTVAADVSSFVDDTVAAGPNEYDYRVFAFNDGGDASSVVVPLAKTERHLEYSEKDAKGASDKNRLMTPAGKSEKFESIHVKDADDQSIPAKFVFTYTTATGAAMTGFTAKAEQMASGAYKVNISVGAAVAPGTICNIKMALKDKQTKFIFIYVKVP